MKVLQVNCVYKKGSTGKITCDLHKAMLAEGIESVVCYGRGARIREDHVYKTCPEWYSKLNNLRSRITGIMYGGCYFSTNYLISVIRREKPDIVHLQCINGYFVNIYRLVSWLKKNHILTVLTLHAEFMYTGGCGHSVECTLWQSPEGCTAAECPRWRTETKSLLLDGTGAMWKKMKAAFDEFDEGLLITSVSPWLMHQAEKSVILGGKPHYVVLNGLDTGVFHPCDTSDLKKQLGLTDEKIIFHATPAFSLDPHYLKGGYYIAELAKRLKDENVKVIVAGACPADMELPDNMIMLGTVSDQRKLAQYYAMADVTVLASQRETFSMVTAESLCCGTPVAGFKAGGPEQITIPEYSRFVDHGDLDKLTEAVRSFLNREKDDKLPVLAAAKYATETMTAGYLRCYQQLLHRSVRDNDSI